MQIGSAFTLAGMLYNRAADSPKNVKRVTDYATGNRPLSVRHSPHRSFLLGEPKMLVEPAKDHHLR